MRFEGFCRLLRGFVVALGVAVLTVALTTCSIVPEDGQDQPGAPLPGDDGEPSPMVAIVSFKTDFGVSALEDPISVFYRVITDADDAQVTAFYAPIATNERTIIRTNLPVGENKAFDFDPRAAGVGSYHVGIIVTIDGTEEVALSEGIIRVEGSPDPRFFQPCDPRFDDPEPCDGITEVSPGADVPISFDAGDPEGIVRWRLFYLAEGDSRGVPPDELGTQLATGSGNVGSFNFSTTGLPLGDYEIGVSATDTGFSISATVDSGDLDRIVTIPGVSPETGEMVSGPIVRVSEEREALPPTIEFHSPGSDDIELLGDETLTIEFTATVREPGATGSVDVLFYDDDNSFDNRIFPIKENLSASTQSVQFDTSTIENEGTYYIGASISDGINARVVEYATGRIVLVRIPFLNVTEPSADSLISPSVSGSELTTVPVSWTTNVPGSAGLVDVFAKRVDDSGQPSGAEIPVLDPTSLSVTTAEFSSNTPGRYQIFVRISFGDPNMPALIRPAPGRVRVSVGTGVQIWLGLIGQQGSVVPGEVFQGVNFQDNAGVYLDTVEDLDRDGNDDFMITARYGKPYFQNPSGIGIGEAYLIYGGERRNKKHNLNTVGTSDLKGIVFPGVRPRDAAQEATDGLSAVRRIPDQDGDDIPELMFGMSFTDSRGHTYPLVVRDEPNAENSLEKPRQFVRGGVVIVSSRNEWLTNPPEIQEVDADAPLSEKAAIYLDLVGQNFIRAQVNETWPDQQLGACTQPDYWRDELNAICVGGTDGCWETFVGPWDGFNRVLANSYPVIHRPFQFPFPDTASYCPCFSVGRHRVGVPQDQFLRQCVLNQGRGDDRIPFADVNPPSRLETDPADERVGSGFYPLRFCDQVDGVYRDNAPLEPFGTRIIGRGDDWILEDRVTADYFDNFGASIAVSGGFVLVSAPNRTENVSNDGVIYMFNINHLWPDWHDIMQSEDVGGGSILHDDGEIHGNFEAGIFIAQESITGRPIAPPMPYQYQIETEFQCGRGGSDRTVDNDTPTVFDNTPFHILGEKDQKIEVVEAVPDFNLDRREDFAIGAPVANSGDGAVYVCYRRDPAIEGDYLLSKLSLDPSNVNRLAGLRINGRPGEGEDFGQVLARNLTVQDERGYVFTEGIDFNGDGDDDLILPNPGANGETGEVIIVFAALDLVSPAGGFDIANPGNPTNSLLDLRLPAGPPGPGTPAPPPRAIAITGLFAGDQFGFNVAVVGDVNGDQINDLLVAAPGASPHFDTYGDGIPDTPGLDLNKDGDADDVSGPEGVPDGIVDMYDHLLNAGIVYLIYGDNLLAATQPWPASGPVTISIGKLGTAGFSGRIFNGRSAGDHLGGGVETKKGKRSYGVGAAGNVDGDGFADFLFSSILADPEDRTDAGEVYLIYGS